MKGKLLLLPLLSLALVGCQSGTPFEDLLEGRKIDYESGAPDARRSLQYPPDLLSASDSYEDAVSLSEYTIQSVPVIDEAEVAQETTGANIAYRRDGKLRWVHVALPADEVWTRVRSFWTDRLEFPLVREEARLGVMETDWLELREGILSPGLLGGYFDRLLNRLRDSGERDKFVTRLERSGDDGVDVYISHRHILARYSEQLGRDGNVQFVGYERQESDQQLEVEMMRRLMLYLAGRDLGDAGEIEQEIAVVEGREEGVKNYELVGTELFINRPWQESWQLAQIGLDRGGFTLEDRDFQERFIIIRHSGGPDSDKIFGKAETSFFNKLFGEEKPILRNILLFLEEESENRTRLTAQAAEGDDPLTVEQQSAILELLAEYLP